MTIAERAKNAETNKNNKPVKLLSNNKKWSLCRKSIESVELDKSKMDVAIIKPEKAKFAPALMDASPSSYLTPSSIFWCGSSSSKYFLKFGLFLMSFIMNFNISRLPVLLYFKLGVTPIGAT